MFLFMKLGYNKSTSALHCHCEIPVTYITCKINEKKIKLGIKSTGDVDSLNKTY